MLFLCLSKVDNLDPYNFKRTQTLLRIYRDRKIYSEKLKDEVKNYIHNADYDTIRVKVLAESRKQKIKNNKTYTQQSV